MRDYGLSLTHKYRTFEIFKAFLDTQNLKNKINANPNDWKNYYLLTKMYLLMELDEVGEEWFFSNIKNIENSFLLKFLCDFQHINNFIINHKSSVPSQE